MSYFSYFTPILLPYALLAPIRYAFNTRCLRVPVCLSAAQQLTQNTHADSDTQCTVHCVGCCLAHIHCPTGCYDSRQQSHSSLVTKTLFLSGVCGNWIECSLQHHSPSNMSALLSGARKLPESPLAARSLYYPTYYGATNSLARLTRAPPTSSKASGLRTGGIG